MGTAIVTGSGAGLGRAIALRLAGDGFVIAGIDADAEAGAQTVALVEQTGGSARRYTADLRDGAAIDTTIRRIESDLGPITALVNNAAIFPVGAFLETPATTYDDVVAVNQRAYFLAAQSSARLMINSGGGAIVNIGSITQSGGWADMAAYVVTKGAAATLTRALATELGCYDIRVNCVAPGAFPTRAEEMQADQNAYQKRIIDSQALKRRGRPEELAAAVSFLVGPDASFVTGQALNVVRGWI
ncbi:MAG: SDR family NAD(P)-dependent oxidoreductase, partial [Acidimicrobiales bacterium]